MKKMQIVGLLFWLSIAYILFTASSNGRATAANQGNTGAPTESTLCSNCHTGGTSFGTVTVSIQVFEQGTTNPVSAYVGGTTYDMRVTVSNSAGNPAAYGFQMTCLKSPSNSPLGGYSNLASNVKQKLITVGTFSGRTYVEHNGVLDNNVFNFSWTAPVAGSGTVKFYSAGNAVNDNNSSGGDRGGNTSLTLPEYLTLNVITSFAHPTCFGSNNGTISLNVTGSATPFAFLWSDGNTMEDRTGLDAGEYSVTVTDNSGAESMHQFILAEPALLAATAIVDNPLFPGEPAIVDFEISGGTGAPSLNITGIGDTPFPIELPDGSYSYTITDANGCMTTGMFEAIVPEDLMIDIDVQDVSCNGSADGSIILTLAGATPPYTISWSNDVEGDTISNLNGGVYMATITDAVGYEQELILEVEEPAAIALNISQQEILCNGQTALVSVTASGGTEPLTGMGAFNLAAGTHEILVTDANGCSASEEIFLAEPEPFEATATSDTIQCTDDVGVVIVSATGGTEPYMGTGSFEVTSPGLLFYPVADAHGCMTSAMANVMAEDGPMMDASITSPVCSYTCDGMIDLIVMDAGEDFTILWSDGSDALSRNDLCAGMHSVALTDQDGCTITNNYFVPGVAAIGLEINATGIACYGETTWLAAEVVNAVEPFSVAWSNGSEELEMEAGPGEYMITITDANLCMIADTITVTQPDSLSASAVISGLMCFGDQSGSIDLVPAGGTWPYEFMWSEGSDTEDLTGVGAGVYNVVVSDDNGCSKNFEFMVMQPDPLEIIVDDFMQGSDGMGTVEITVTGGTLPYSYEWSDGQGQEDVELATGSHTLTVTDNNGCQDISTQFVIDVSLYEQPDLPVLVYPNPVQSVLHITSEDVITRVSVYNMHGMLVFDNTQRLTHTTIDASEWSIGMYSVVVEREGSRKIFRVTR